MPPTNSTELRGTDPWGYVRIASTESAVDALRDGIRGGCAHVLLEGPTGIGKTMALRVLAAREQRAGRQVLFSPFLHLPPDDVARWLLHLLDRSERGAEAQDDQFLHEIRACGRRAMLVIVDELQSTPLASVQRLAGLATAAAGGFVLVTAGRPGHALAALRSALPPTATVSLCAPLPSAEMRTLCDALLLHSGIDLALRRTGSRVRDEAVERADGIPGSLMTALLGLAKGEASREVSVATPPSLPEEEEQSVAIECPSASVDVLRADAALHRPTSESQGRARSPGGRSVAPNDPIRAARPALVVAVLLPLIALSGSDGIEASVVPRAPALADVQDTRIRVQVNARPWALIRVDDVEVGATPLSHLRVTPGPHEFEAEFADGRSVRRRVVISAEHHSVSLP